MTYIVTHWKTSVTGLLTATVTVTGVLMQYHIVGPAAGSGTLVGIVGAFATAFLGLIAKDPGK